MSIKIFHWSIQILPAFKTNKKSLLNLINLKLNDKKFSMQFCDILRVKPF